MRSKLVINLDRIDKNVKTFLKKFPKEKFMAILKADAYGHGSIEIAKYLIDKGISWYGVASLDEALQLRAINEKINILILGPVEKFDIPILAKKKIDFTVTDMQTVDYIMQNNLDCRIHIALETGMGRIGFAPSEIDQVMKKIKPIGIFSHLAVSETLNNFTKKQIEIFDEIAFKYDFKYRHILNSYGTFNYFSDKYDLYRIGIMLYGGDSTGGFVNTISLKSRVSFIKKITEDASIGYGRTYIAKAGSYIATVSIGYADGVNRKLSNKGFVFILGKRYKIIGNICMDQLMVEVDDKVKVGDEVEIFGDNISIQEVAELCETISYEIMCNISRRVKKVYVGAIGGEK